MLIKSFKAPTLKEAMANVKAELGVDAVILHTSKTKKGGILGFHSKEVVEVIAAVEDEASKPAPVVPANEAVLQAAAEARSSRAAAREAAGQQPYGVPKADMSPISAALANFTPRSAVNQYQTAGTMEAISQAMAQNTPSQTFGEVLASVNQAQEAANEPIAVNIAAAVAAEPEPEPMQPVAPAPVEPVSMETMAPQAGMEEPVPAGQAPEAAEPEKIEAAKAEPAMQGEEAFSEASMAAGQQEAAAADESGKDEEIRDLQNQLEEMKAMLMEMSRNKGTGDAVPTLQNAMQSQEVTEKIIQDMIAKLNGTEILAPSNSVKAANALEKYIRKAIRVANGITLYSSKPKVVALIGPTGVGKTTTLAKIAAKFVLEQGARVALITADTYRISAVEQLKTYSDILGLPLEIVYNPEALRKAIEKHKDKQLILIDTAGRSQYNEYQMKELSGLLSIDADIEKHLVMSATTKTSDGVELLENFSICQPDRVIFTKVDETGTHGIILNILHRRKVALSYITNGQSVPDDIEPASVERLAELLLR
ncbi:MAG: flagellar biosynthesis protein FlhF [Anaerovibrio sp.]